MNGKEVTIRKPGDLPEFKSISLSEEKFRFMKYSHFSSHFLEKIELPGNI
jgi:hypothetical protein